jgi:hypothetical protein
VADVGAAAVRDARTGAPILDNRDFVNRKSWFVFKYIGDAP